MTKKAKTKTKSDETPPKSVPPEKQSTEPGAGAGADLKADAAPPPQPPTPAGAGPAPQPPAAAQPEAPKTQALPPAADTEPPPTGTKCGEAEASEPTAAVAQVPAQLGELNAPPKTTSESPSSATLGPIGSPPGKPSSEKPPPAQASAPAPAPAPLRAVGSPPEKTSAVQSPVPLGAVGSPKEKPPAAPVPAQLGAKGSPPRKTPAVQETVQLGAVGSPSEKVPAAPAPAQLGTIGSPPGKPPATQAPGPVLTPGPVLPPAQLGVVGSPPVKTPPAKEPIQFEAMGSSPDKSPAAQAPAPAPAQLGAIGSPAEKLPAFQAPAQLGAVGSPVQKPPDLKQDNTSNGELKPNTLIKSESLKEQSTTNNQPSPSVGGPSLSPTANEKKSEVPVDKSLMEKGSKTVAPPKAQGADKNQKGSSATPKAAPNGQSSKKPAEKQNKRQVAKESAGQKDDPNVNKAAESNIKQSFNDKAIEKPKSSSEPKTAKGNNVAKLEDVASTQIKDEPTKSQPAGAAAEMLPKQGNASEVSKKAADAEPPKQKDSNKNIAAPATDHIKSAEKPEKSKDPTAEGKTVEQKVESDAATWGNQQKPASPKREPSDKNIKNAPSKKNKHKNETGGPKTEGPPNSKEANPAEKGGKKDTTEAATGSQPSPEVSEVRDKSKKSSSNVPPNTKLPTLEVAAPDHSAQAKEVGDKNQQTKVALDSSEVKEGATKDDAQSKSSGKKKNRQQKKSISEDIEASEETENKGPQEVGKSKNNEKKKPAQTPPSKEKEPKSATASAPAEKNRKNVANGTVASGAKVSAGKPSTAPAPAPAAAKESDVTTEKDSSGKTQGISAESQSGEEGASKKKKRNRHKKKNKAGDGDSIKEPNVEGGKQQDRNVTAGGGESKVKEKQQTTASPANKSKGQQKVTQPGQANASKGTQLVSATTQEAQVSSETPALTASAKKRNRRKKKGVSGTENESETGQPQENKSVESNETPAAKPEEQKAKINIPSTQTKTDEVHKKKTDSKPTPKLEQPQQQDEGSEDQSENFVEVKSKNKRNKKKKQDAAEAKEDSAIPLSSSNNAPKGVPEGNKTETENTGRDSAKEVTNKVAAPKISQEAREQKMLNKKLAERAQLKIKKQIETNALSEVEKSEKYLETITKNLRELTKLRSSKLEDVLQQPGDEEFDYEYTPVQRITFLATTCHVCKESKPREATRICEQCHLMSYCSEEHQKSDWPTHKDLCQAISDMYKERGTDNLYAPAVGLSAEEYRAYRMNALLECSAILNRQLEPYEQEIILYPNVCHTCHLPSASSLHTCESCSMVSYCSPKHRPPNHDVWCHDLQLYKSLIIYQSRNGVISPQLPAFLPESYQPLSGDMQSHLRSLAGGIDTSPLERAVLSEIATGPLTALFALQKSNKVSGTTDKLVIHFVGAEWSFEMERADKWEVFLLHQIPSLKTLVLVFVGPEVCNLPPEARGLLQKQSTPCPQCQERGRRVELVIAPQTFYHEYVASQEYIPPTLICAYNAGLYRPNGHKDVDSWAYTVEALLKDPGVPVAVTSYTAEEVLKDAERLQQHRPLNCILPPSQNPYRSLRPNRNFASDDVTPVIFKNYYIMIATSLGQ